MGLAFNGTTSNLVRAGNLFTAYPAAFFCWVKTTTAFRGEMILGHGDNGGSDELMMFHDNGDDKLVAFSRDGTTSYKASSTNTASTSWTPCLVVFTSASSRTAYYGAGAKVTDTSTAGLTLSNLDRFVVGVRGISDTLQFLGDIAHVAIWTGTVPGDSEWTSLAAGANPLAVMNSSLLEYWPLATSGATQTGSKAGYVLTATSTSTSGTDPTVDPPPGGSTLLRKLNHFLRA